MAVFSAPFAILACICAALPFLPPSEAARLPGGRSVGTHSPAHSSPQTHNSFLGGSAPAHEYSGESNAYRPTHRDPPLLRHFRAHDNIQVHHHDEDPHDRTHEKTPRSAFARSRYRRERGPVDRRSSVYVSGEHGDTYLVSRISHRHGHKYAGAGSDEQPSHTRSARQIDESDLAMGRIDIMVATPSAGGIQRLASLTVDASPIDWTPSSDHSSVKAFPLNVSTTNQTQFIMMPMDDSYTGTLNRHVALATGVFDAGRTEMVMYCATYNPDPGTPSALVMTPCASTAQSDSSANDDVADPCADATSSNPHQSQIFSYDPFSGKIEPISAAESASSGGVDRSSTDEATLAPCAAANVRRGDAGNATTTMGRSVTGPSATHSAPTAGPSQQQARNVTLVYVAGAPELAASPSPPPASSASTGVNTTTGGGGAARAGQAVVFTTTITTTVVATATTSGTTSRTMTPAKDAASVPVPSTPSPSTTAPTSSATTSSATATATSTTARSASNLSSTASTTPAAARESLEIEVVGVTPSTTAGSSSTSTTIPATTAPPPTTRTTATPSSHGSASPTLDPMAVASMIESQTADRRRAVVMRGFSSQ